MTIILLEALAALALFVGAIWWTMFSGRDKGELRRHDDPDTPSGTAPEERADTSKSQDDPDKQ